MIDAYVRGSIPQDVAAILDVGLREADSKECQAAGLTDACALSDSYDLTPDCRTVVVGSKPTAMFGVAPIQVTGVRTGIVWFLGTDNISKVTTRFLRESKKWLENISADYDLLTNVVHQSNKLHVRWLKWLGFIFLSRRLGPFIEFVRINPCVTQEECVKSSTVESEATAPKQGGLAPS